MGPSTVYDDERLTLSPPFPSPWQNGWTPLHFAADYNRLEVAQALIAAGANLEAKDKVSST